MHIKIANIISKNLNQYDYGILTSNIKSDFPENKILYCKNNIDDSSIDKFKACLIFKKNSTNFSSNNNTPIYVVDKDLNFEDDKLILKIDHKKSIVTQIALLNKGSVDLYLTGKCNQKCFACPSPESSRNDTNPKKEALRIAELLDGVETHINVTGGEPTYYNDYFIDVIKMLQKKALKSSIQVLTTAISFANESFVEKIIRNHIKVDQILFSVALYGSKNHIQDLAVGVTNSLSILNESLLNMIRLNATIEIRIVITKYNYADLEDLSEYILKKYKGNILRVVFMGLEMSGNAKKNQDKVWVDFESHNPHLENAILNLMCNGIQVRLYNYPLCYLKKNYWTLSKDSISYWKKSFKEDCDECSIRKHCSGFFAASLPYIKKVYPVQGEK